MKRAIQVFDYLCIWLYVKIRYMTPESLEALGYFLFVAYWIAVTFFISLVVFSE